MRWEVMQTCPALTHFVLQHQQVTLSVGTGGIGTVFRRDAVKGTVADSFPKYQRSLESSNCTTGNRYSELFSLTRQVCFARF